MGQRHADARADCWEVVRCLHMNEVRLLLLYPEHLHMTPSSDFSIQGTDGILRDPCFNHGYNKVLNVSELRDSPCTRKFQTALPFQLLNIQGTGNFQQCQQSISKLFNTSYCPYSHCSFNSIFLPPLHGQFGVSLRNDKGYWLG